ncbi:MAG: virulence RhuM family protein [Oscillospiraceae bacterium]|nr:virulence RhuM family protein [Oscillospiraceae bacterium]
MTQEEISTLNLIVNMYLDYAELQAKQHHAMHMAEWELPVYFKEQDVDEKRYLK